MTKLQRGLVLQFGKPEEFNKAIKQVARKSMSIRDANSAVRRYKEMWKQAGEQA